MSCAAVGDEEPLVLTDDHVLGGLHVGPVRVKRGTFELAGVLHGRLRLHVGARALVRGTLEGELVVAPGVTARVLGCVAGRVVIEPAGELVIEPGGRVVGDVANDGALLVRGTLSGVVSGPGQLRLEGAGVLGPSGDGATGG